MLFAAEFRNSFSTLPQRRGCIPAAHHRRSIAACVNGEDHDGDFRLSRELMARGVQVEWLPEEQ